MTALRSLGRQLGLEGNMRVLALQTLVSQLGFGMLYVVWQPYLLSTGIGVVEVGVIQSVINLATAGGLIVWGILSDRVGRKPIVLVSNACRVLAVVALIVSGSYLFLMIFAFFVGLSCLFMQTNPARSALISESVNSQRRATAFSVIMAISQITSTVTALAGGYFALVTGYYVIFYITAAGDLIGILLIAFFIRETREGSKNARPVFGGAVPALRGYLMPEAGMLRLYLIMVLMGVGYGAGYAVFYSMLVDGYGFNTFQLGLLSTMFSLVGGVTAVPIGRLSDRVGRKPMLLASCVMSIVAALGYIVSSSFEMFMLFNLASALDMSFWLSTWMSFVSEKAPPEGLSTIMGKLDSYSRLAGIPSPWLGGLLYEAYGFAAPLEVAVACSVAYTVIVISLKDPLKPSSSVQK